LNERKDIASSTNTNVNLNDELIAIDTTKYLNERTIKAVNLKYPTWNKLTSELAELNKTWANN